MTKKRSAGNSEKQQRRKGKPRGRPFKAGKSGNPNGRPKLPDDVRLWLSENKGRLTVKALLALEKWIDSDDNKAGPAAIRIWLGKVLPDAAVAIELSGPEGKPMEVDYSKLSTEQLHELRSILAGAAAHTTH